MKVVIPWMALKTSGIKLNQKLTTIPQMHIFFILQWKCIVYTGKYCGMACKGAIVFVCCTLNH